MDRAITWVGPTAQHSATASGITRKSNALAQEKTGKAWVEGRMFGTHTHGEFEDAEVSVFLGKNVWHSHGFDQARRVPQQIARDARRSLVAIDPRRTEGVELIDKRTGIVIEPRVVDASTGEPLDLPNTRFRRRQPR